MTTINLVGWFVVAVCLPAGFFAVLHLRRYTGIDEGGYRSTERIVGAIGVALIVVATADIFDSFREGSSWPGDVVLGLAVVYGGLAFAASPRERQARARRRVRKR